MFNQNIISNKFDLNLSTTLSSYNLLFMPFMLMKFWSKFTDIISQALFVVYLFSIAIKQPSLIWVLPPLQLCLQISQQISQLLCFVYLFWSGGTPGLLTCAQLTSFLPSQLDQEQPTHLSTNIETSKCLTLQNQSCTFLVPSKFVTRIKNFLKGLTHRYLKKSRLLKIF